MSEYRIVRDKYLGYEVQVWNWYFPFWKMAGINTHPSIERAEAYARAHAGEVVKYLGELK